jgi:hypothetical protein
MKQIALVMVAITLFDNNIAAHNAIKELFKAGGFFADFCLEGFGRCHLTEGDLDG